jgi:outer membrane protein OmpA-like peptidoglycan-associated protein
MKTRALCVTIIGLILAAGRGVSAEEGPIGGVELGVAIPFGSLYDRADGGGVFSPYAGYMFNDYVGVTAQAQVVGAPNRHVDGIPDSDAVALFGGLVGPRVELPLRDLTQPKSPGETYPILHIEGQGGVFTGLAGSATSGTAFGYSTGGGVDFRISNDFLVGLFARYNWADQRVTGGGGNRGSIEYATTGLGLTYNAAPPAPPAPAPPPPAPVVASAAPAPPPAKKKIVLRGVQFDFNRATIRADAQPILDEAITTLQQEGGVAVIAEGYTDDIGSDTYNEQLSLRRANAVRDYLTRGGIAGDRISVEGFGKSHPVASNATADGRAQNRRVELRVRDQ